MATTTWTIDPSHSEVGFKVKHLMITNVKGTFNEIKGKLKPSAWILQPHW
jgi:polyisoprenoid-binding protein YceI